MHVRVRFIGVKIVSRHGLSSFCTVYITSAIVESLNVSLSGILCVRLILLIDFN